MLGGCGAVWGCAEFFAVRDGSNALAWRALAGCTQAIVAPIHSAFSKSAAQAAGVPLVQCCAQAWVRHVLPRG